MKHRRLLGIVAFLSAGGWLSATMAPRLTIEELVERSDLIVEGRCLRTWSAWDAPTQFVWTHTEIQVWDSLKGDVLRTVVVSEPGGAIDGVEMSIDGVPRYRPGEDVVAFLYRTPIGLLRSRGLGQGKFRVVAGPAGGVLRVQAELEGAAIVEPAGAVRPAGTGLQRLQGTPLQEFKSRVRGLIARRAKGDGR